MIIIFILQISEKKQVATCGHSANDWKSLGFETKRFAFRDHAPNYWETSSQYRANTDFLPVNKH